MPSKPLQSAICIKQRHKKEFDKTNKRKKNLIHKTWCVAFLNNIILVPGFYMPDVKAWMRMTWQEELEDISFLHKQQTFHGPAIQPAARAGKRSCAIRGVPWLNLRSRDRTLLPWPWAELAVKEMGKGDGYAGCRCCRFEPNLRLDTGGGGVQQLRVRLCNWWRIMRAYRMLLIPVSGLAPLALRLNFLDRQGKERSPEPAAYAQSIVHHTELAA